MISKEDRIFSGVVGYFPNALAAIGRWSERANEKHNPGEPMHWAFGKSTAHLDAAMSHLTQAGRIDPETGVPHLVNAAWRVLAALETSLIEAGATPGVNVRGAPAKSTVERLRDLVVRCPDGSRVAVCHPAQHLAIEAFKAEAAFNALRSPISESE